MQSKRMSTLVEFTEVWEYQPDTGWFIWKVGSRKGLPVSTKASGTYISLMYQGYAYRAARVAWLMYYGKHPKFEVDHINGEKWDNRINNLRDVPHSVNQMNQRCHRKARITDAATQRQRDAGYWINGALLSPIPICGG